VVDGDLGLGTRNSSSHFDNLAVREFIPPPPAAPLPVSDDFDDGIAQLFEVRSGDWLVDAGRYSVGTTGFTDGISTLRLEEPLPSNLDLQVTIQPQPATGGLYTNAYMIFDYQGPTDFKFAGAQVGNNRWAIGHRTASAWVTDKSFNSIIGTGTDYDVRLVIENGDQASLWVDGVPRVMHAFADSVTDGSVGLGVRNAVALFDDVTVQEFVPPPPPPPVTLPVNEDFDDGAADLFAVQRGNWSVESDRYRAAPIAGSDAVSTLTITDPLPPGLTFRATVRPEPATGQLYSNGYVIFDYQSPTNFKFAGAQVNSNRWVIGHRTSAGWVRDQALNQTIAAGVDYEVEVVIHDSVDVSLVVGGIELLHYSFSDHVTDGSLGLGTRKAVTHFDNVVVQALEGGGAAAIAFGQSSVAEVGTNRHHLEASRVRLERQARYTGRRTPVDDALLAELARSQIRRRGVDPSWVQAIDSAIAKHDQILVTLSIGALEPLSGLDRRL
jgi:hypothetical protein